MSKPPAYWKINLLWSAFNVLNLLSVWHVLAVTLDRHWAVQRPARYLRAQEYLRRRPRLLPGAAAAAWATAAAFCFVPSLFLFVWGEDIADEVSEKLAKTTSSPSQGRKTAIAGPTNSHPLIDTTLYTTFCALQRIFNIFDMY